MSGEREPGRLGADGDVPTFLREGLAAARRDRPSEEQLRSLAAGLSARIGAPVEPPSPPGPGATEAVARTASGWAATGTKMGIVLLVAAGGAGVWELATGPGGTTLPGEPARSVATVAARPGDTGGTGSGSGSDSGSGSGSGSGSDSGSGSGSGAAPRAIPAPAGSVNRGPAVAAPAASPRASAVDELSLLTRAQRALDADPAAALALVAEHERTWPSGNLAQEREVVAVEALVRLGRRDEARARGDAFAARFPTSPYRRRLDVVLSASDGLVQKPAPPPPIQP